MVAGEGGDQIVGKGFSYQKVGWGGGGWEELGILDEGMEKGGRRG